MINYDFPQMINFDIIYLSQCSFVRAVGGGMPQGLMIVLHPALPGMGRLLQSKQGLVQAAHQSWSGRIREASGLTVEDSLTECAMEEDVFHIELLERPVMGGSNSEHHAHGGRFDNRAERLIVVHTRALREPPEDPASLVAVESPVRERLVGKNSFVSDGVGATRPGNKVPGPIAQKGLILFLQLSHANLDQ
jgi:hypothetical protein